MERIFLTGFYSEAYAQRARNGFLHFIPTLFTTTGSLTSDKLAKHRESSSEPAYFSSLTDRSTDFYENLELFFSE